MKPFTRTVSIALLTWLAVTFAGCGFHARGAKSLPPVMARTYIESAEPYNEMSRAVRAELLASGAEIVERKEDATAIIWVRKYRSDQRILSVGRSAKATEYELFEEITFSVLGAQGQALLAPITLQTTRDYVFDETRLLGKVEEAEELHSEMRRTLARQMLTRIRAGLHDGAGGAILESTAKDAKDAK
jgi:LPS-assembly lipoprotein